MSKFEVYSIDRNDYVVISEETAKKIIETMNGSTKKNIFGDFTVFPPDTLNNGEWFAWHRRAIDLEPAPHQFD
jgi:hypothetical protein